jgi:membrane protease YdiL (CAAX protease family)
MDTTPTLPLRSALIALLVVVALEALARPLLPEGPVMRLAATGVMRAVEAFGLLWWISRLPQGLAAIGLDGARWRVGIRTGAIWSVVFALAAVVAGAAAYFAFSIHPLTLVRVPLPPDPVAAGVFVLIAGLVSPIAEEIVFRGILFNLLRRWGAAAAIVGTTMLFTAAHFSQGFPLVQLIGGFVFAVAMESSRSLLTPIIIHVLGNLAIYGLSII